MFIIELKACFQYFAEPPPPHIHFEKKIIMRGWVAFILFEFTPTEDPNPVGPYNTPILTPQNHS